MLKPLFRIGDKIRVRRVEVMPGQFLGQSGYRGEDLEAPGVLMAVEGPQLEYYYTVRLHGLFQDYEEAMPESWLETSDEYAASPNP